MAAIARGSSNAEICEELFIGDGTVKSHVSSDRTQIVVFAYERSWSSPTKAVWCRLAISTSATRSVS